MAVARNVSALVKKPNYIQLTFFQIFFIFEAFFSQLFLKKIFAHIRKWQLNNTILQFG